MTAAAASTDQKNRRLMLIITAVVMGMVGLSYASVPLYRIFCQVTGFGGTTQVSDAAPGASFGAVPREVSFNGHVVPGLQWKFEAPQGVNLKPGEETTVIYRATNISDQASTGTSTFNVTPNKIGPYFMKIDCFCFIEQTLQPGESVDMPVVFYLDPEIDTDINTAETPEITLSYTFFPVSKDGG